MHKRPGRISFGFAGDSTVVYYPVSDGVAVAQDGRKVDYRAKVFPFNSKGIRWRNSLIG